MKIAEEKIMMAFALGAVTCKHEETEHRKIKLETVNKEWKGYEITGHTSGKNLNNTYSLWYHGDFGIEKGCFTRLMMIEEGWNIKHATALLIASIDMHKAEVKNE